MCADIEGIHEWLQELNREVFGKRDCFTVGEGAGINYNNALPYIQADRKELNSFYHFQLSNRKILSIPHDKFRDVQSHWADLIAQGGWAVQYLSNHDSARQVSCYGSDGQYRTRSAKLLATLIHTTPGMPFIYQGEEETLLIVANYSGEKVAVSLSCVLNNGSWTRILTNTKGSSATFSRGEMAPWEVEVYKMK